MRRGGAIHVCRFDTTGDLVGKDRTYEKIKAVVLQAGRFSVFEATETRRNAALFTRLCRDPELEILRDADGFAFPWTGVRRRRV